jgi:hypothetical protein
LPIGRGQDSVPVLWRAVHCYQFQHPDAAFFSLLVFAEGSYRRAGAIDYNRNAAGSTARRFPNDSAARAMG